MAPRPESACEPCGSEPLNRMEGSLTARRKFAGKTGEQRRSERRARLIQAGVETYGERGYRNATVKAVCEAAGLTERYFYESFQSSEALLCACFHRVTGELLAAMRRAGMDAGGPPMLQVRAGLLRYLHSLRDNPAGARVYLIELASVSPQTEAAITESLDAFGALLVEMLLAKPGDGSRPSPMLLRGVVGGGLHIARAWISSGYAEDIDTVADTALRLYALVGQ